ncbi:Sulphydryl oxidase [Lasiodiplodia theobromae]|uniref:Sulphydryl oxidase n=1 Tax=Lasiodiplodia theobromae TaxID=45133 RepID=UPI0015C2EF74|nr:Sulphydryl oxidase [Lasiodiplodia theobromae]KAF4540546.1 Sulphydryl oxidase [Lasiodiplodia theobromae]
MAPLGSLLQLALATLALGGACRVQEPYDVIIVGGGPSGLGALSGLARVRRKVLLIDSAEYRNAHTRHMHDVLGFDGVTPAYFRWAARKQISHYDTVSWTNGTVEKIVPASGDPSSPLFTVTTCGSNRHGVRTKTHNHHLARRIVLATGLRDLLPATPGIAENWARGEYWCPWCDGHEHADQPLGLVGPLAAIPGMVRETQTLNNRDVVAFVNGTDTPQGRLDTTAAEGGDPRWMEYLRRVDVRVDNRVIAAVERLADGADTRADPSLPSVPEYDRFRVHFTEGEPVDRAALMVSFGKEQRSDLGERLGVALYGGQMYTNAGMLTNVPGVYAVGDANLDNSTNVPHAMWSGKRAAVDLHVDLERERERKLLAGNVNRREAELDPRSVWTVMNGEPGDVLYAGDFDK